MPLVPTEMWRIRKKLGLSQREAGEIFGPASVSIGIAKRDKPARRGLTVVDAAEGKRIEGRLFDFVVNFLNLLVD